MASFAVFLVGSLNDNPGCNELCTVTTDQVNITPTCGSVILSIILNISNTSVPDGVDASDLVEYFVSDVIKSLNKSSDGSPILILGDRVFNLGMVCGPTTNCSLVIQTDNPTQPITDQLTSKLTTQPTLISTSRSTATPVVKNEKEAGNSKTVVAIAVVVSVVGVLLLLILVLWVYKKNRSSKYSMELRKARDFWGAT